MEYWRIDKEKLKYLAKFKGYHLKDLSKMCGKSAAYLSSGSRNGITAEVIHQLEAILGENVSEKGSKTYRFNRKETIRMMQEGISPKEVAQKLKIPEEVVRKVYREERGEMFASKEKKKKSYIIRTSSGLTYR